MMPGEAVRLTKLGSGMTLIEDGGPVVVTHVKSRRQINAEYCFRKIGIKVSTLNRCSLFRKLRLEDGTPEEYMEFRLSMGKRLPGKKQDKFIAGIVGTANSILMQDMLVLGRATTDTGQTMLIDAIIAKHGEYPLPTMMSILTTERCADLTEGVREKIKVYLGQHKAEEGFGRELMEKMLGNAPLDVEKLEQMFAPVLKERQGISEK